MVVMTSFGENIPAEKYAPQPHHSSLFCPDPNLGLTPERSPSHVVHKKSVRFISPAKSRAKRKVLLPGKENTSFASIDLPLESIELPKAQKTKTKKKALIKVVREDNPVQSSELSQCDKLEKPELHTTLHLAKDILHLQTTNIDLVEAVKHRLTVSEPDRSNVKQKAFAKLNERPKSPSAYSQVVSVNVPAESVIQQTEKALNKSVKPPPQRPKPAAEKPSLDKLFRPDLAFHHCVSFDQHGYQPRSLALTLPSIDQAALEHHEKVTLWEKK
ncbi:uncharacterized protein [Watersipora subatra]|uniref:uncharacterized protein n=1 Tax=Watersipora subatra TaxID=2589382 RepID=UPI00355BC735